MNTQKTNRAAATRFIEVINGGRRVLFGGMTVLTLIGVLAATVGLIGVV